MARPFPGLLVEAPQIVVYDATDGEDEAALALARLVAALGIKTPLVVTNVHGKTLASPLAGAGPHELPPAGAGGTWASDLGHRARRAGADAVVAIGGGRCLDIAKLAAARAGVPLVAAPTQLSHDGICSPVAVVHGPSGHKQTLGAIAPRAVFVSVPTLMGAPLESARAGIGDLLANPLALRDWKLAAGRGLSDLDDRAWDLSVESYERIGAYLDDAPEQVGRTPEFLRCLADALILSGLAMIEAGTSRPASGGEHEISHALDELYGGRAMHGAQVAFGCIVSTALYDGEVAAFRRRLVTLGLPSHPADLGLDATGMVRVLLAAPDTRPGRFTIIEDADLDESSARTLVTRIWGDE